MDIWGNYKSKLGYLAGDSKIDTYGVDHSKFSLRDEIAYQMARADREGQLIKSLNSQGITKDYPQYGTNFWGGNAENNYGFGSSDISENIENVTNALKNKGFGLDQNTGAIAIVPQQKQTLAQPNTTVIGQNNALGQQNSALGQQNQNAENIAKLYSIPSLQNNSALKPLDDTNSYTTESAWSYPNTTYTNAEHNEINSKSILNSPSQKQITDEDLYKAMWENIKKYEDVIQHPYLDTKGLITVGGGANINSWDDFRKINFTVNGVPATEAEKLAAFGIMRNLSNERDAQGNPTNWDTKAKKFKDYTNVRISDEYARSLAQDHMTNDLAHVRREFADFDTFPQPLKEVLLDIQYNVKGGLNEQKWPSLYKAIRERNINGENGIVANVHRKDVQQERNDWARRMAASIIPW